MSISWWPLPVASKHRASLPPLLISTSFTSNSYAVHLTDLTHIWSESLDRKDIIRRSLTEDTSIDPSEDAEQFRRFLGEIKRAIAGEKDTTLRLSKAAIGKLVPDLDLYLTVKLPRPLKALEWPMHFGARPQSAVTARLTIPLLRAQNTRMQEMASLVDLLREKDAVIQKLVDKLEATGAELGHVFPAASGKGGRKIARKVAEERVKGLGMFQKEEWESGMRTLEDEEEKDGVADVVSKLFATGSGAQLKGGEAEIPDDQNRWWETLGSEPLDLSTEDCVEAVDIETNAKVSTRPNGVENSTAEDEDDGFQIQATPVHSRGHSPMITPDSSKKQQIIADSTDDEEDLDVPSQHSAVPDSYPAPKPHILKKIGKIGGPKTAASAPQPKPSSTHVASDEETATEEEDDAPSAKSPALQERAATPPPAPHPLKKGGFGKIGGWKKDPDPTPAPPQEYVELPERLPKPKLGHIGHKAVPEVKVDVAARGEPSGKVESTPEPIETDEQRADRKREELKRQLEEKSKAPVKKRRKF